MTAGKTAVLLAAVLAAAACQKKTESVEREDLFSLNLGVMEDELDFFERSGAMFSRRINLSMQNGFFYIANSAGSKVMKFSSYGDILELIYNPQYSPPFAQLNQNKRITARNFNEIGLMAVGSEGSIFIEDRLPSQERDAFAALGRPYFDREVLWFDAAGTYKGALRQGGLNSGEPLPVLVNLKTTLSGGAAAVARSLDAWQVFWFDGQGRLAYDIPPFTPETLPKQNALEAAGQLYIENIFPDLTQPYLYLSVGQTQNAAVASEALPASYVYIYDIENKKFISAVEAPQDPPEATFMHFDASYEFLGADEEGFLYFLSPVGRIGSTMLKIVNLQDSSELELELPLEMARPVLYRNLDLAPNGIVSALLCHGQGAEVLWWRVDKARAFSRFKANHLEMAPAAEAEPPVPADESALTKEEGR